MEKWKGFIIPLVIINFVITLIIFSYLIITGPYERYDFKNDNDDRVDITGTVMSISKRLDGITMLVEGKKKTNQYDKAYVTVDNDTQIIKTIYSRTFRPEEINIGDKVEVKFKGPVAESYPVQATAGWVWIIESDVK